MQWIENPNFIKYINRESRFIDDFSSSIKIVSIILLVTIVIPLLINLLLHGSISLDITISDLSEGTVIGIRLAILGFVFFGVLLNLYLVCLARFSQCAINIDHFNLTRKSFAWWNNEAIYDHFDMTLLTHYEFKTANHLGNEFEILMLYLDEDIVEIGIEDSLNVKKLCKLLDQIITMPKIEDPDTKALLDMQEHIRHTRY